MYRIFGTFICIQGNGAASCPRSKKWIDCGLIAADFVDGPRDQGESQLVDSRDNLELFLIHAVSQIFQDACFHVGLGKGGVIILADGKKMKAIPLGHADKAFIGLEIHQTPRTPIL